MKPKHPRSPCSTCPFRKDAELGYWDESHFRSLLDSQTHHEAGRMGSLFFCHKHAALPAESRGFCAGWLLSQKADGVSSIALRLRLIDRQSNAALRAYEKVTTAGLELFASVEAMCSANLTAIRRQKKRASARRERSTGGR